MEGPVSHDGCDAVRQCGNCEVGARRSVCYGNVCTLCGRALSLRVSYVGLSSLVAGIRSYVTASRAQQGRGPDMEDNGSGPASGVSSPLSDSGRRV